MRKDIAVSLLALCTLALVACGSSPTEPTAVAPSPSNGRGTLIVTVVISSLPSCPATMPPLTLYVDGELKATVQSPGDYSFDVAAGTHTVGFFATSTGMHATVPDGGTARVAMNFTFACPP
jgi:hypothetical protein